MTDHILTNLLSDLNIELTQIYDNQLCGVYLFGSYARGEQDPEF